MSSTLDQSSTTTEPTTAPRSGPRGHGSALAGSTGMTGPVWLVVVATGLLRASRSV